MFFTSFAEGMTAWMFLRLGFRLINGWQVLKRGRRSHAMFVGYNYKNFGWGDVALGGWV